MNHLFRIVLYVLGVVAFLVAIGYVHLKVSMLWKDVALRQAQLQDVPAQQSHTAKLKKELDAAFSTMQAVYKATPSRDGLVDVISAISGAASASGISVQVPTVKAPSASPLPSGPFSDVSIHIVASGKVASLASFLHRVEHLPYVLRVVSWELDTTQQTSVSSFTSMVPSGGSTPVLVPLGSSLTADIAIVVQDL